MTSNSLMNVSRWLQALLVHEQGLYSHSLRVAEYTASFCTYLGMGFDDTAVLSVAALVHDVGKLKIAPELLLKTERLNEDEKASIRLHPELGRSALQNDGLYDAIVLDVVQNHHERLDGTGYPSGITAGSISKPVRIVTICDVFVAMTEERPYEEPLYWTTALALMERKRTRIDQELLKLFAAMITIKESSEVPFHPAAADVAHLIRHI